MCNCSCGSEEKKNALLQTAFDCHELPFGKILADEISGFAKRGNIKKVRNFVLSLRRVVTFASQCKACCGCAALCHADLRVTGQSAHQRYFIQHLCCPPLPHL